MSEELENKNEDELATHTTRQLEKKMQEIFDNNHSEEHETLTLGKKYELIKDRLTTEERESFERWIYHRNKYVHAKSDDLGEKAEFIEDYKKAHAALGGKSSSSGSERGGGGVKNSV